jgi:hypothetical protein
LTTHAEALAHDHNSDKALEDPTHERVTTATGRYSNTQEREGRVHLLGRFRILADKKNASRATFTLPLATRKLIS